MAMAKSQSQAASPAQAAPSSSETVCVAANIPLDIRFKLRSGKSVIINGNASHLRGDDKGVLPVGGYGLTVIPRESWEEIQKTYGGMRAFKEGLIFACDTRGDAEREADSRSGLRNGNEPREIT
jgi:hypothetical protein